MGVSQRHFEGRLYLAVTTELHDVQECHDGEVPFEVNGVGLRWVYGDASDDDGRIAPNVEWGVVEEWNVVVVVEECVVVEKVNVDGGNGDTSDEGNEIVTFVHVEDVEVAWNVDWNMSGVCVDSEEVDVQEEQVLVPVVEFVELVESEVRIVWIWFR